MQRTNAAPRAARLLSVRLEPCPHWTAMTARRFEAVAQRAEAPMADRNGQPISRDCGLC